MKKIILVSWLISLIVSLPMLCADDPNSSSSSDDEVMVTIITNDQEEFEIPKEIAEKSLAIRNMLGDLEGEYLAVSLAYISSDDWNKVYPLMEKDSDDDFN